MQNDEFIIFKTTEDQFWFFSQLSYLIVYNLKIL